MTIGVGVRGTNWAVIGSDSLGRVQAKHGLIGRVMVRKIQQFGPCTYAMWAGKEPFRVEDQPALSLPPDPAECADALYLHVRFTFARMGIGEPPHAIILTGDPPRIFRVTEDENTEAEPGQILDTAGQSGSYSIPSSESVGRRVALRWLSEIVRRPGMQGECVDYPLYVLSVGPSGVVKEVVETESDLPSDLPTMGV